MSRAQAVKDSVYAVSLLSRLDAIPSGNLSHEEIISRDVLRWEARGILEGVPFYWLTNELPPYTSFLQTVRQVFATYGFTPGGGTEGYLALLSEMARLVSDMETKLKEQLKRGIVLPKAEIAQDVAYLRTMLPGSGTSPFAVDSSRLGLLTAKDRTAFQVAAGDRIARALNPGIEQLIQFVDGPYRAAAGDRVGLSQYPNGDAYYRHLARMHTTLDASPDSIHRLGLAEVDRLMKALDSLRSAVGFTGSLEAFRGFLKTDARFFPKTPEAIGLRLSGFANQMESKVNAYFLRRPKASYGVRRLAPDLEPSMTFGYYQEPRGADTVGRYYFNGSKLAERNLINGEGLTYHELLPGHHFQINLQLENTALPAFRRESFQNAYSEGWGDYASLLGIQMGLYRDPYDRAGRIGMSLFLATRLVVDVGMNHLGWSREKAAQYMRDHIFEGETQIQSETLRYAVAIPGQALGYRMGSRKFEELRQRAQRALGAKFDIRRFHDAVLSVGSIPMTILDSHVNWWIEQERGRK